MSLRHSLALALFVLPGGCIPKVVDPADLPVLNAGEDAASVYFKYGKAELASEEDEATLERIAGMMRDDPRLYAFLAGYADPTGNAEANLALSAARTAVAAERVVQVGDLDPSRVIPKGLGTIERTGRGDAELRRVDFIFVRRGAFGSTDPEKMMAVLSDSGLLDRGVQLGALASGELGGAASAALDAASGAMGATASGSVGAEDAPRIEPIGLPDVDALFARVQTLLDTVQGARNDIAAAESALRSALKVGADTDVGDALTAFLTEAASSLRLDMSSGKPRVTIQPGAPLEVGQGAAAVNNLVEALTRATAQLAKVPAQAQAIVAEAKSLPASLPGSLQKAGTKPLEILGKVKTLKKNISLATSIPKECTELGKQVAATFRTITDALS